MRSELEEWNVPLFQEERPKNHWWRFQAKYPRIYFVLVGLIGGFLLLGIVTALLYNHGGEHLIDSFHRILVFSLLAWWGMHFMQLRNTQRENRRKYT